MNEEALSLEIMTQALLYSFKSVSFNSLYNAASFPSLTQVTFSKFPSLIHIVLSMISVLGFLISRAILSREKA